MLNAITIHNVVCRMKSGRDVGMSVEQEEVDSDQSDTSGRRHLSCKAILTYECHAIDNRERELANSNILESFSNITNDYIFEIGYL